MVTFATMREQVYEVVQKLCAAGLIRLSAGNIGLRGDDDQIAITPSGLKYDRMTPDDVVIIDYEGNVIDGREGLRPSSEFRLHTAILRALPEVGAVVHTHSVHAMTFAALGREVPVLSLEVLVAGGPIPVAPYACPGTAAVGEGAARLLAERPALMGLLLQNHGLVAVGPDLDTAYEMAYDIEVGTQIACQAFQIGQPAALTADQIAEVRAHYHLPAARPPRTPST